MGILTRILFKVNIGVKIPIKFDVFWGIIGLEKLVTTIKVRALLIKYHQLYFMDYIIRDPLEEK